MIERHPRLRTDFPRHLHYRPAMAGNPQYGFKIRSGLPRESLRLRPASGVCARLVVERSVQDFEIGRKLIAGQVPERVPRSQRFRRRRAERPVEVASNNLDPRLSRAGNVHSRSKNTAVFVGSPAPSPIRSGSQVWRIQRAGSMPARAPVSGCQPSGQVRRPPAGPCPDRLRRRRRNVSPSQPGIEIRDFPHRCRILGRMREKHGMQTSV